MHNKNIIIEVIKEDMRYNQYLNIFRKSGIDVIDFNLDLMSIVAALMNITEEEITDEWINLYESELSKSDDLPIEPLGKNLNALAEQCYFTLLDFKKHDDSAFT